jgi:hypothetical protein
VGISKKIEFTFKKKESELKNGKLAVGCHGYAQRKRCAKQKEGEISDRKWIDTPRKSEGERGSD